MNYLVYLHALRVFFRRFRRRVTVELLTPPGIAHGNSGLWIMHGSAAALSPKTVIVLGAARGGTSMIAGVLDRLGVHMGARLNTMFEDAELVDCLERNDIARARAVVAERNARYPLWGFKHPRVEALLSRWQRIFRAPVYVLVFRDALATGARRAIARGDNLDDGIDAALDIQKTLLQFVRYSRRPCLLVSYEKALLEPQFFVAQLAAFLGIDDSEACARALAMIEPSPTVYRLASGALRAGDWRGRVEKADDTEVVGWACRIGAPESVEVELLVNGVVQARMCTNVSRQDVQSRYPDTVECSGFVFVQGISARWRPGDELAVRLAGSSEGLPVATQAVRR